MEKLFKMSTTCVSSATFIKRVIKKAFAFSSKNPEISLDVLRRAFMFAKGSALYSEKIFSTSCGNFVRSSVDVQFMNIRCSLSYVHELFGKTSYIIEFFIDEDFETECKNGMNVMKSIWNNTPVSVPAPVSSPSHALAIISAFLNAVYNNDKSNTFSEVLYMAYKLMGGTRSTGVFQGNTYDKIKMTVLSTDPDDKNLFGFGTPIQIPIRTADFLRCLGVPDVTSAFFAKYPLDIELFYSIKKDGSAYVSGFTVNNGGANK